VWDIGAYQKDRNFEVWPSPAAEMSHFPTVLWFRNPMVYKSSWVLPIVNYWLGLSPVADSTKQLSFSEHLVASPKFVVNLHFSCIWWYVRLRWLIGSRISAKRLRNIKLPHKRTNKPYYDVQGPLCSFVQCGRVRQGGRPEWRSLSEISNILGHLMLAVHWL
jgi:hypothetical protein